MDTTLSPSPLYLIVHSDHPLDPTGPNSGAEMATLNHARYIAATGRRVCLAARLKHPISEDRGVHFIDLGASYDVERALDWADTQGAYVLLAAGKALSIMLSRRRELCLRRVLITHDRCAGDSGLKPEVLDVICDGIVCVSHAQKEKLASEGAPEHKMTVVHNGVDFSIFNPSPPSKHKSRRLVFAGALVPDKGLHLLISAFAELRTKYSDVELEVFGSSSLWSRSDYLNTEQLAAQLPGLTFHGKRTQHEIADGFRRSGICVVPSIWFDPYPLISLEAQACGTPVVAFRMGGLPEGIINGTTGVVVDEISPQALAGTLDTLLSDPHKLSDMSAQAASNAAIAFRWETVVEKIIALCEPRRGSVVRRVPIELKSPADYMRSEDTSNLGKQN
jgi:glycosyltransferase involved in cell wall biosynthesis